MEKGLEILAYLLDADCRLNGERPITNKRLLTLLEGVDQRIKFEDTNKEGKESLFKKIKEAHIVSIHPYMFRPGQPAKILGVDIVAPDKNKPPRACFHVQYSDLFEDWIPVSDTKNYHFA